MHNLFRDFNLASRTLAKSKAFTATAVFTLALSLAATTVVFTVVNAVLVRTLPYADSDRLMVLHWQDNRGQVRMDVTSEAFFLVQQKASSFEKVAATYPLDVGVNLSGIGAPRYRKALRVSAGFLPVLSAAPFIGRDLRADDDRPGGDRAAILSYSLWQQDFASSPSVVGRSVRIDHEAYTVVGVMPKDFQSYPEADMWLPMQLNAASGDPGSNYRVLARLKSGVSREQAQTELTTLSRRHVLPFIATHPEIKGELVLQPLQEFLVGRVRGSLVILFGAVVFVLMIACTNLAILLLVRGLGRRHEIATRAALGSSRLRIMHIPLTESLLLAVLGGLAGLILAKESLPFVLLFLPTNLPLRGKVQIDGVVLGLLIAVSLLTVLIFGLLPAWKIAHTDFSELLRRTTRGVSGDVSQIRTASVLVSAQTALTLVLLAGAASLFRSFLELRVVDPGFDSHNVVVGQFSLAGSKYSSGAATALLLEPLVSRLQSLPEVESAATVNGLPLEKGLNLPVYPTDAPDKIEHAAGYTAISPDYFNVMRIPRLAGRYFEQSDKQSSTPVAIVNETLARRWWPHESAVGHFLEAGEELGPQFLDRPRQIVGVVSDIHEASLDRVPGPTIYVPAVQVPDNIFGFVNRSFLTSVVVRTRTRSEISSAMSKAVLSGDPDLALASQRPLNQVLATSLAGPKFYMSLTAAFGMVALLLTAIGFWGLLRYQVQMRTKEIGIRIAVGARPSTIMVLFAKQGLKLAAAGLAAGTICAYPLVRFLEQMFYTPHPGALGIVIKAVIPMCLIAIASSILTSLQAATIEPSTVLRTD